MSRTFVENKIIITLESEIMRSKTDIRVARAAAIVAQLQKELSQQRKADEETLQRGAKSVEKPILRRSQKLGDQFVHSRTLFPDFQPNIVSVGTVLKWKWATRGQPSWSAGLTDDELEKALPVRTPAASELANPPHNQVAVTWLGHASVLVQWEGWSILTDPVFSQRCAPSMATALSMGPTRVRPAPLQANASRGNSYRRVWV
eukprot:Selendium_serpulae@DN5424_c0_g2_i4.p2